MYWGLSALYLLGKAELLDQNEIVAWVLSCQKESGGFGGSPRHDAHLLHTLSAIQVLAIYDKLHLLDASQVAACERMHLGCQLCCLAAHSAATAHVPQVSQMWLACNSQTAPSSGTSGARWTPGGDTERVCSCA